MKDLRSFFQTQSVKNDNHPERMTNDLEMLGSTLKKNATKRQSTTQLKQTRLNFLND
jgi:hypothetical protein